MNRKEQQTVLEVLTEIDRLFKIGRIKDGDKWSYGLVYPHTFTALIPRIEKIINNLNKDLGDE